MDLLLDPEPFITSEKRVALKVVPQLNDDREFREKGLGLAAFNAVRFPVEEFRFILVPSSST